MRFQILFRVNPNITVSTSLEVAVQKDPDILSIRSVLGHIENRLGIVNLSESEKYVFLAANDQK